MTLPAVAAALPELNAQSGNPAVHRKKVAAIVTEYRWYSHADVICGRLLGGYSANNVWKGPRTHLVSLYRAQTPSNDMGRDLSARHGFRIYPSIREALTLGGPKLAVDAVVFVGEHGKYPFNDIGQHLYPRFELFSEILDVYEASGKGVPTFFDKHLSYDWKKGKTLYDRVRKLGLPFMCGSSLPLTLRKPDVQPALNTPMSEAACIGHGPLEAYGFHLLEVMQCIVERRKGGETGVREVQMLRGDDIWSWLDGEGAWAKPLLEQAYALDADSQYSADERTGQGSRSVSCFLQRRISCRGAHVVAWGKQSLNFHSDSRATGIADHIVRSCNRPAPAALRWPCPLHRRNVCNRQRAVSARADSVDDRHSLFCF